MTQKLIKKIKNTAPISFRYCALIYESVVICQPQLLIGGGDILRKRSNFRLSRAHDLDLTLDRVILHTVIHHSLTSTYITNFIEIEETYSGRMYGWTFETHFIWKSRSKNHTLILLYGCYFWRGKKMKTWVNTVYVSAAAAADELHDTQHHGNHVVNTDGCSLW